MLFAANALIAPLFPDPAWPSLSAPPASVIVALPSGFELPLLEAAASTAFHCTIRFPACVLGLTLDVFASVNTAGAIGTVVGAVMNIVPFPLTGPLSVMLQTGPARFATLVELMSIVEVPPVLKTKAPLKYPLTRAPLAFEFSTPPLMVIGFGTGWL